MPDKGHIAKTVDLALRGLRQTAPAIADCLGIEPPKLDFPYRDREYLQAEQLKELAAFNQRVITALQGETAQPSLVAPEPVVETANTNPEPSKEEALPAYDQMSFIELKSLAKTRGIKVQNTFKKPDIVMLLLQADHIQNMASVGSTP